ncbi:MAG: ATP-binding protein [Gallionellaceae bacterium]
MPRVNMPHPKSEPATVKIRDMKSFLFASQPGHNHLRRLVALRAIAIAAQCATLFLVHRFLAMELEWRPILAAVAALALLNLLTWLRVRSDRPVTNAELFGQLCADVLVLAVLLYYSGGSTNPFVSLFLLPLVIAAATLPAPYTWSMAVLTTICYTALMKFYVPLSLLHGQSGNLSGMESMDHDMAGMREMARDNIFNLHVLGMWLGFVLSAGIIAWFVVRMAQAVRDRDESLADAREETLRNERIVALGTLAAGAAHALGTPLSTMSVVIGEMRHEDNLPAEWQDSLALLDGQVRNCRRILDRMLDNSQACAMQLPGKFIADTLEEWRLLRPATECRYRADICDGATQHGFDPALRAALLNLLNNAADASPESIEIEALCNGNQMKLAIMDHGPGLTPEVAAHAGSAFFTTKGEGRGLGLFLANATLERLGGKVRLFNREGGGTTTEVILPLQSGDKP